MFCADYIAAYIFHGLLTVGSAQAAASLTASASVDSTSGGDRANRHENELVDPKTFDWLLRLAVSALGLQDNTITHIGGFPPTVTPLLVGVGSGVGASLTLYPFDFVRGGVLTGSSLRQRLVSSCSTVPYAGVLFGAYFSLRDPGASTPSNLGLGVMCAAGAALAEAPFDHAKQTMFASKKVMIAANMLYVPFAALMLVMYDKAATKFVKKVSEARA